ncbi:MAG: helicase-related protein [Candidatus Saccharimonadales bacterium]
MDNFFDNKTRKVGEDLQKSITHDAKLRVSANIFSIYGFEALKKQLKQIDSFHFIYSTPTFLKEAKESKQKRQFSIRFPSERSIAGTEFEINLKNELKGRAVAKETQRWIEQKARFKTNTSQRYLQPQTIIEYPDNAFFYNGIDEFSSAGLGFESDNSMLRQIIKVPDQPMAKQAIQQFDDVWNDTAALDDVTEEVSEFIANLYRENSPSFVYYLTLFNIFDEFLEDITEDELANEKTGFRQSKVWSMLYDFQRDAVLGVINKLERHNGCILADSVGLGKTFSALGVIKYYQERNKSILVLCPKKLGDNWQTFLNNYEDNPLIEDRFNYDVLYHTDLQRETGFSNGMDLSRINWGNYDLVVIDESHNFRNNNSPSGEKETRYQRLLNHVMRAGVQTKVLMLSATPVNNRFTDLKNQLALAYEGHTDEIDEKLDTRKSINFILQQAQKTFNEWSKLPADERTSAELLQRLSSNYDFFKLLDGITISRSRKHIARYYNQADIGTFPTRLKPITIRSEITDLPNFPTVKDLYDKLTNLNLSVYAPTQYILPDKVGIYAQLYDTDVSNTTFTQSSRENTLKKLMRVNFLKRLESSVDSFRLTLTKFAGNIEKNLAAIQAFEASGENTSATGTVMRDADFDSEAYDEEIVFDEDFSHSIGQKVQINIADIDTLSWKADLQQDLDIAQALLAQLHRVTPEHDTKLQDLKRQIVSKLQQPINENNKKVIIFSAFADTANYLYQNIAEWARQEQGLYSAMITGSDNKTNLTISTQFNNLLINFSPLSKNRSERYDSTPEIDILIATDCISEGQNLQDCDTLINYDIHWNPVRIIQRFGRIDRIGSQNSCIQLVNFWPQISLDDYINLKSRVEDRMMIVDMSATGEDNVLTNESSDLAFRKQQLERLQNEVVDIEDMDTGVSITDLGLNDFRMDLVTKIKEGEDYRDTPSGMHAIAPKRYEIGADPGVIYVLRNINETVNIDNTNQLHPFYLVYISDDGQIISDHLRIKKTLDTLRAIARNEVEPIRELYEQFNEETNDGKYMEKYSDLLTKAIGSIIDVKEESDLDSLFSAGGTTAASERLQGLKDFELVTFMVVR